MKNLAVILAKDGSKRVPNKNTVDVCGQPMFTHVIDIAKAANCDDVVVSTDSYEIAETAVAYGADDAIIRAPEWEHEWEFGAILQGTIKAYEEKRWDTFTECTLIGGTGIFLRPSWIRTGVDLIRNYKHLDTSISQVHPADINGVVTITAITRHGLFYQNKFGLAHYGINLDIDYPEDLELARQVMSKIKSGEIDYSLDENVHENAHRLGHAKKKASEFKHLEID